MRQAGALAGAAGAAAPLVAAALLHDVGHLRSETDARHGAGGAQWLSQWFGPADGPSTQVATRSEGIRWDLRLGSHDVAYRERRGLGPAKEQGWRFA